MAGEMHSVAQAFGGLALLLGAARLGAHAATRVALPAVVGELVAGIALGAAGRGLVGWSGPGALLQGFSEFGVLLLMFELGLESSLGELRQAGLRAALVAVVGMTLSCALGAGAGALSGVTQGVQGHLFLGVAVASTSIGVTARVFRELGQIRSAEARLVLAAAVIDDVLGLVALAALSALTGQGEGASPLGVVARALGFFAGALAAGKLLVPALFAGAARLAGRGGLLTVALVVCCGYAWAAGRMGLAPAIGAFFAGVAVRDEHAAPFRARGEGTTDEAISPLSAVFVPVFFVLAGAQLDLAVLADRKALVAALLLTVAAVAGKLAAGALARGAVARPLAVGVGLIPRGEVSLIVISVGAASSSGGAPLVGRAAFGAVLVTVVLTSLLPPLLLARLVGKSKLAPREGDHG